MYFSFLENAQFVLAIIYGEKLPFDKLLERIKELENRFHTL